MKAVALVKSRAVSFALSTLKWLRLTAHGVLHGKAHALSELKVWINGKSIIIVTGLVL